ncbi:MAG: hypothetical protein M1361_01380 [Patescibacteria group bacterium]|nr:hypothetical protein [Patescibacteria group bacterium]MCL5224251.1 hypothetical protein [Patescibacteria group bacterium]
MDNNIPGSTKNKVALRALVVAAIVIILAAIVYSLYSSGLIFPKVTAADVAIANCNSILPQAVVVTSGQPILFENNDGASHTIFIGGSSVDIPAGKSVSFNANLAYGAGAYGYACDGRPTPDQVIVVK